ncbi:cation transporter [bacterium]|nr:cation transporter [bacterium]
MSDCGCEFEASNQAQRRVLIALMAINGVMFVAEFGLGWLSQSTGLIADSLDMLADASVYAISLYAVGRAATAKTTAARLSGWLQISLACLVLIDVARRSVLGSDPQSGWMIGVALVALAANVVCLWLLRKHRDGEVHMRAAWIFSANDVIANMGVIAAGILVMVSASRWPDLVIGLIVAGIVLRGGIRILRESKQQPVTQGANTAGEV